jgi:lincosamide nucleotidyltransferase A/C/D/E
MDAARVLELLRRLEAADVPAWLDGGWCVDALLGEQTRRHDDLDLVAPLDAVERLEAALAADGYELAGGGAPQSLELVDAEGHQVDVHPVVFTEAGDGLYRLATGEDWVYPAAGFAGTGRILGQSIGCLTPETLLVGHTTGYALDAEHERDVLAVAERYELPVPPYRRTAARDRGG